MDFSDFIDRRDSKIRDKNTYAQNQIGLKIYYQPKYFSELYP